MTQRLKITLTDAAMDELRSIAARDGVPVSRIAAERVSQPPSNNEPDRDTTLLPTQITDDDFVTDNHAPWIEPIMGDEAWRRRMWASIVALYGRYPHALATSEMDGGTSHPISRRSALSLSGATGSTLLLMTHDTSWPSRPSSPITAFSSGQEGGSVTNAWTPGAPPIEWFSAPSS
jgi:hypothetical protein